MHVHSYSSIHTIKGVEDTTYAAMLTLALYILDICVYAKTYNYNYKLSAYCIPRKHKSEHNRQKTREMSKPKPNVPVLF